MVVTKLLPLLDLKGRKKGGVLKPPLVQLLRPLCTTTFHYYCFRLNKESLGGGGLGGGLES